MSFKKIEIHFPKSRSKYYKKCIQISSSFQSFIPIIDQGIHNILTLQFNEIRDRLEEVNFLVQKTKKWEKTMFRIDGEFDRHSVDCIFSFVDRFLRCSKDKHFFMDEDHCRYTEITGLESYGWGCRYLNSVKYDERDIDNENKYWYEIGHLVKDNKWMIEKSKIFSIIEKEAKDNFIDTCLLYDEKRIKYFVEELPDYIDLSDEEKWGKKFSKKGILKTIIKKDISNKPKPVNRPSDQDFSSNNVIFDAGELEIDAKAIAREIIDEILEKHLYPRETLHILETKGTICDYCKHALKNKEGFTCKAFPDKIPNEIISGQVLHLKDYPGQVGNIHFELSNEYTSEDIERFFN